MNVENLAKAVLATAGDGIIALDREGTIGFWNPGAERMFGFARDEAVGRPVEIIIPHSFRESHDLGFRKAMETGATRYGAGDILAVPAVTRGGHHISVEISFVLLRDAEGAPEGVVAIMRDVTARDAEIHELRKQLAEAESVVC